MPVSCAQRLQAIARVEREVQALDRVAPRARRQAFEQERAGPSATAAGRGAAGTAAARPPGPAISSILAGASGFAHGSAYDAEICPPLANDVSSAAPSWRSTTVTSWPSCARYHAAVTPTTPAPRTSTRIRRPSSARRAPPPGCSCRRGCGRRTRCRRARPAASTWTPAARRPGYAASDRANSACVHASADDRGGGVRRMLQRIVGAIEIAFLDRADLARESRSSRR